MARGTIPPRICIGGPTTQPSSPQYTITGSHATSDLAILDANRNAVPVDPNSPEFCTFLTWASNQKTSPHTDFARLKPGTYFASLDAVVDYCKHRGVTLQVEILVEIPSAPANDTHQLQAETPITLVWSGNFRFYQLFRCVALPSGTGQTAPNGIVGEAIPCYVSADLLRSMNADLQNEDSPVRCLSSWTVDRAFVYVDVSDFSKYEPGQQVLVINTLIAITEEVRLWDGPGNNEAVYARENREASVCIGDGYIYVFKSAISATAFASYLAQLIETLVAKRMVSVEFHFRTGVHFGPVFRFWDFGRGSWNYIGAGINGGQRVLSAVGKETDDVVFVSSAVRQRVIVENKETSFHRSMRAEMANRGRRADKHGNPWRVYEVNHTALSGMLTPTGLRSSDAV